MGAVHRAKRGPNLKAGLNIVHTIFDVIAGDRAVIIVEALRLFSFGFENLPRQVFKAGIDRAKKGARELARVEKVCRDLLFLCDLLPINGLGQPLGAPAKIALFSTKRLNVDRWMIKAFQFVIDVAVFANRGSAFTKLDGEAAIPIRLLR